MTGHLLELSRSTKCATALPVAMQYVSQPSCPANSTMAARQSVLVPSRLRRWAASSCRPPTHTHASTSVSPCPAAPCAAKASRPLTSLKPRVSCGRAIATPSRRTYRVSLPVHKLKCSREGGPWSDGLDVRRLRVTSYIGNRPKGPPQLPRQSHAADGGWLPSSIRSARGAFHHFKNRRC